MKQAEPYKNIRSVKIYKFSGQETLRFELESNL